MRRVAYVDGSDRHPLSSDKYRGFETASGDCVRGKCSALSDLEAARKTAKKDKKCNRATIGGKQRSENETNGVNREWIVHLGAFLKQLKLVAQCLVARVASANIILDRCGESTKTEFPITRFIGRV